MKGLDGQTKRSNTHPKEVKKPAAGRKLTFVGRGGSDAVARGLTKKSVKCLK